MFRMDYRTRKGASNLSGKARIFVTGHQGDQEKYLEETIENFLEYGNYSIWFYNYNPQEDLYNDEMIQEHIENAQLMAILVTRQLLENPGVVAGFEVPVARKARIPILPIVLEVIDDSLFANIFGNLHYLAPHVTDESGIPFEEKLKNYLESVLVGEQQIDEIRSAFRKKVFLSYRKKDRKTAKQLIEMIHKQSSCYDVGVWYDEFLKPGRDFNNEIKKEIETCDVFALNVTPSILEEDNYVKNEEVPCALENGKPILSVEMAPTDKEALQQEYPEIFESVQSNEEAVEHGIIQMLGEGEATTQDAARLYCLGLAYLDGFYAEKNAELAKELLVEAARRGLTKATEKLGVMYHEGKGVPHNMNLSLQWRQALVQQLEEELLSDRATMAMVNKYHESCLSLGQDFQKERRFAEAEVYYKKMLILSQSEDQQDFWSAYQRSVCLLALGDMEKEKGHFNQAVDKFVETIKLRFELLEKYGDNNYYLKIVRRALAVAYLKLGDCEKEYGYNKSALDAYEQCLKLRRAAFREIKDGSPLEYEARRDLAVIQIRLGELYEDVAGRSGEQEHVSKAFRFYQDSLRLRIGLYEELQTDDAQRDLGVAWCRMAGLEMRCGMLQEAGEHLEKGFAIRKELAEKTGFLQDKRNLAKTYELKAEYHAFGTDENVGFLKGAFPVIQAYQNASELMKEVVKQTGSVFDRRILAGYYTLLGDIYKDMDQKEMATLKFYHSVELSQGIQEDSAEEIDNGNYISAEESASALYRLGTADNTPKHREFLHQSYVLWSRLSNLVPEDERYKKNAEVIGRMLRGE